MGEPWVATCLALQFSQPAEPQFAVGAFVHGGLDQRVADTFDVAGSSQGQVTTALLRRTESGTHRPHPQDGCCREDQQHHLYRSRCLEQPTSAGEPVDVLIEHHLTVIGDGDGEGGVVLLGEELVRQQRDIAHRHHQPVPYLLDHGDVPLTGCGEQWLGAIECGKGSRTGRGHDLDVCRHRERGAGVAVAVWQGVEFGTSNE